MTLKVLSNRDPRFLPYICISGGRVETQQSGNVDFSGATMSGLCPTRYTSVVRTMNFGIIVGILRLMSVIIRVEAVLQPICWALRIEESMFVNVRMILIWALVFMCLPINSRVISREFRRSATPCGDTVCGRPVESGRISLVVQAAIYHAEGVRRWKPYVAE